MRQALGDLALWFREQGVDPAEVKVEFKFTDRAVILRTQKAIEAEFEPVWWCRRVDGLRFYLHLRRKGR